MQYRDELSLNVTVLLGSVWQFAILRGTDSEYYCVCCEGLCMAIDIGTAIEF